MLDRASTFANKQVIDQLKNTFIPVAIDQAYQRRQADNEGEFYRRIASQGPRNDFKSGTTQGLYAAAANGDLLGYTNHRSPERVIRMLNQALEKHEPQHVIPFKQEKVDTKYNPTPPENGLILRVQGMVLGGYAETNDPWKKILQNSLSRDNLWIKRNEHALLAQGEFPKALQRRIARYHLTDATRGEPPMWKPDEVREIEIVIRDGKLSGNVHLETKDGRRGYIADILGEIESSDGGVTRLDAVAKGEFWGAGRYTKNPPPGRFPLAVSFTLADGSDLADSIPPQASRGWVSGYFQD